MENRDMPEEEEETPLVSLNHVSFVCRSVPESVKFYEEVLGFTSIKRPSSFNFQGAWLFNYGIGIHLLQCNSEEEGMPRKKKAINPKDNHISFQCSNMRVLKHRLEKMGVQYVTAVVEEGNVQVHQLFFHDPDGHMIEICNCEDLPVLPLSSCPVKFRADRRPVASPDHGDDARCGDKMDAVDIDNFLKNVMSISL
ncbi:hypothetical protein Cni_G24842 [Canna indica]|uniref:VOC domain-containing protein n=1 Tax=Canna indica TaxID=4628 RepID=A0AAQ3KWP9_9LILI|nr:hypothetical protein Cni_G24842 [Canna indica]